MVVVIGHALTFLGEVDLEFIDTVGVIEAFDVAEVVGGNAVLVAVAHGLPLQQLMGTADDLGVNSSSRNAKAVSHALKWVLSAIYALQPTGL